MWNVSKVKAFNSKKAGVGKENAEIKVQVM